ncbi:dimethyladenosine transferase [Candidatus Blochmanniella floridana]|uniref:Ribosomal RNA small subunit methyltransferase A n=1 Tax=Blochmanniella floridana TaxID=203907 RepID=RSMA_BLOFL|nr:RecName: Full=Ribosomal RNA small subunit methyltransferase A; AltName: Full=16S rRNA (adenine(1518)-N(6)/adenine(1519)-N(6))-dimethyltransferase; AltName: Full=16S rRNA dimethyladenosine transferase; AltName: Full=16S rRNA dimethylase; AltName: Full=S-adenosylmethionine-6-N', N'-adenosyl(rRNA) dimethyltransferase [Candidatus Blochmannia floridanus]CAD83647.1 dimethyladenosine transferase [Candidatus Blochmannia floridanus]
MQKKYYKNHVIQKKWGQIFLKDQNIIHSIISILNLKKYQNVIEIGPGLGALTKPISDIIDFLILIERDPNLVNRLLHTFTSKKVKIFNKDAMTIDFSKLLTNPNQKIRLIGNLPYNISTKLIIHLYKYINIIHDMHFMLQKEVAQRIVAQPNNKAYGRLSIFAQYYCKVQALLEVPKKSFIPIPKVESMIVQFIPYHTNNPYPTVNISLLSLLTKFAFHQRRKIIHNSLSSLLNSTEIIQCGINTESRAENLTIQQFCKLTTILHHKYNLN